MSPVYSTDKGRLCPHCGGPYHQGTCSATGRPVSALDGIVRLQRQTKGRNGKPVVIVTGIPATAAELKPIAKKLKTACGVGGSVVDDTIVIQGDKRERLQEELEKLGYTVKLSGG